MRYRSGRGRFFDTVPDVLPVDEVVAGLPSREFRWYRGRRHHSGWYGGVATRGHVVYESRLESARIAPADLGPGVAATAAQPVWPAELDDSRVIRSQGVVPGSRRRRSRA